MLFPKRVCTFAVVAAAASLVACSSKSSDSSTPTTPTTPTPAIAISASASTLDLTQGATASFTATVTRSGGFAGDVAVTIEGLPASVTASALTITAANSSGTVTLTAAAAATVASSNLTVRGSGTGVTSVTAAIALNVRAAAAAGAVSVSFSPSSLTITQGATVNVTATITRTGGFTGPVTLAVTGAPAGLTVVITPTASANQTATVTTNGATLAFTASSALTVGTYNINIAASGTNVTTNTVSFATTVNPPVTGTANSTWTFCPSVGTPLMVLFQDGTAGTWTRVTAGPNNTFPVTISQTKGAVAYVIQSGTSYNTTVFYGTQAEIQSQGSSICLNQTQTPKTLTGTVTGLGLTDFATVYLGGTAAGVQGTGNGSFTLNNVANGVTDLVATKQTLNQATFSFTLINMVIRRNQNYAAGSAITPTIDLSAGSSEAFAPVQKNLTLAGLGTDQAGATSQYYTANGAFISLPTETAFSNSATHPYYTLPSNKQVAGDYHYAGALAAPSFSGTPTVQRFVGKTFFAGADQTLTFGPNPSAVTVSTLTTSAPVRLRAAFATQAEYNRSYSASWTQSGTTARTITMQMTTGYVGSVSTLNMDIGDFAPAGYLATYGLQPQVSTSLSTAVLGWSAPGGVAASPFTEGATTQYAIRYMTFTP